MTMKRIIMTISLVIVFASLFVFGVIFTGGRGSSGSIVSSVQAADGDDDEDKKLRGTWNVTLRFPVCTTTCTCPGGVPNIPISNLNTFLKGETMLVALGSLFAGPGHGSWERINHNHFNARFKFFLFNPNGMRIGSEEVTKDIRLTGPDAFEATSTFDLFDVSGNMTAQGCIINETATRFE
jgi:hypothetical protein